MARRRRPCLGILWNKDKALPALKRCERFALPRGDYCGFCNRDRGRNDGLRRVLAKGWEDKLKAPRPPQSTLPSLPPRGSRVKMPPPREAEKEPETTELPEWMADPDRFLGGDV